MAVLYASKQKNKIICSRNCISCRLCGELLCSETNADAKAMRWPRQNAVKGYQTCPDYPPDYIGSLKRLYSQRLVNQIVQRMLQLKGAKADANRLLVASFILAAQLCQ